MSFGVADEHLIDLDRVGNRVVRRRSLRLLGDLLRPVRWRVALLAVLVVLAQGARALGPVIVASAINDALPALQSGDPVAVLLHGAAYLTVGVAGGLLGWYSVRLTAWVSQYALLDLRRRVFLHVQRLSLEFHERYTSGRAIARQTSDLDAIRELLDGGVTQVLSSFVYMAFIAILLTALDPWSGAILLVAAVPAILLTRWFHRASRRQYRATRVASANLIVQFVETMTGIRAVQAFRRERDFTRQHTDLSEEYRRADARSLGLNGIYDPGLVLIGNLTTAVVLGIDGFRVISGGLAVGTLIAAILYTKRFFTPLEQMARFYNSLQAAIASLEKISGLLEERPGIANHAHPVRLTRARGAVSLRRVTFGYGGGAPQLSAFDLDIPPGQTVALIGATGAGKSTIAKLVARFYDVDSGAVVIDGTDVREIDLGDLRRSVVVVTQEAYLFSGTVADNIALGRPDASREEIVATARAIGAHEFIEALPEGYDTEVNKRGGRLSAGQRQLISFARAHIADPRVLILDEATSSLDIPSEAIVHEALKSLLTGRTAIIIAHRLSTIEIADRVVVLRGGRIVDDDTPEALESEAGEYSQLRAEWLAATDYARPTQRN
ncbi:ABC transporter ATP-binding protein [Protaetiibacter larvae]|uniref:ABC transporter ATP-binding protein n=1 Tax=Protaetiibacter larvae TaxID=2592654 RepID=A0A5C1Y980_9MICO|nr:ABC transporter ATP-binding protein [Protaetiibacter larvae]QEO09457.1 ABC transporter ATP-binding protein [Protaetiibacter larvae]